MSSCVNSIVFMTLAMIVSAWQSLVHEFISPSSFVVVSLSLYLSYCSHVFLSQLLINVTYTYILHVYNRWTWSCPFEDIVRLWSCCQPRSCTSVSFQSGSKVRVYTCYFDMFAQLLFYQLPRHHQAQCRRHWYETLRELLHWKLIRVLQSTQLITRFLVVVEVT